MSSRSLTQNRLIILEQNPPPLGTSDWVIIS